MNANAGEVMGSLLAPRPADLGIEAARDIARRLYRIEGELQPLRSERDQNVRISAYDGATYVLKLSHPAEDPAAVDLQLAALDHLAAADATLPVPSVVATVTGERLGQAEGPGGETRLVRLLTFLPGTLLHQVDRSGRLLADLGASAARLDRALAGFDHPARPRLQWNLTRFLDLAPLLGALEGDPMRGPVDAVLHAFARDAAPMLPKLRAGFVHNDLNPHNLLVEGECISGILDFGDLVHAPFVCDLAIAASYHAAWGAELAGVAACLRGYHEVLPLSDDEIALLPLLIAARHAMTLLITEWRARRDPANAPYILRNNPASRAGLERMNAIGLDRAADLLAIASREVPE